MSARRKIMFRHLGFDWVIVLICSGIGIGFIMFAIGIISLLAENCR
jgi:hypothetical protein